MKKKDINKSLIISKLYNLPSIKIPLKYGGGIISLYPDDIIEHINNKTIVGKQYYAQIVESLLKEKT